MFHVEQREGKMDWIISVVEWIIANWFGILEKAGLVCMGASVIVLLTPTKRDDELLGKVKKLLSILALNPKK